jgi:hypothetical protein
LKAEIASLHDRMSNGGDWRAFRDEIAALQAEANTEEEYVALLEAHANLVAVGKSCFDEATYAKLLPVTTAEYRMFLSKEATEDGIINPMLLERVTRREVEAGRLDPHDTFRTLAVSGASVLGDSTQLMAHTCRHGTWLFFGMAIAAVLSLGLTQMHVSPLWLIALGLLVGWFINERERKRIESR